MNTDLSDTADAIVGDIVHQLSPYARKKLEAIAEQEGVCLDVEAYPACYRPETRRIPKSPIARFKLRDSDGSPVESSDYL